MLLGLSNEVRILLRRDRCKARILLVFHTLVTFAALLGDCPFRKRERGGGFSERPITIRPE